MDMHAIFTDLTKAADTLGYPGKTWLSKELCQNDLPLP